METTDESQALTRKILRISKLNAWSVTIIAGTFTFLSLLGLSLAGITVGLAVTIAGPIEMRGHRKLANHEPDARRWMVGSQVWLMACVLAYCSWRLMSLDPENPFAVFGDAAQVFALVEAMGLPMEQLRTLFVQAFTITYALIAGLTVLFQGGLALYYRSRIGKLTVLNRHSD